MDCPKCACSDTKVVDSRAACKNTRRRRECNKCLHRYTTIETLYIKKEKKKFEFKLPQKRGRKEAVYTICTAKESVVCPKCSSKRTRVYNTDRREDAIKRTHQCTICNALYRTLVPLDGELPTQRHMKSGDCTQEQRSEVCMSKRIFHKLDNEGYIYWDKGSDPYFVDAANYEHFIVDFGE